MKSVRLIVSGKVQGVFFRANVKNKASGLGLNGYAKNLPDGTVEVVAEGDEGKINELAEFIKKGPGFATVDDIKLKHKQPENFKSFEIF